MYQEEFMSKAYLVLLSSDKIREYIIVSSTMFSYIVFIPTSLFLTKNF